MPYYVTLKITRNNNIEAVSYTNILNARNAFYLAKRISVYYFYERTQDIILLQISVCYVS